MPRGASYISVKNMRGIKDATHTGGEEVLAVPSTRFLLRSVTSHVKWRKANKSPPCVGIVTGSLPNADVKLGQLFARLVHWTS
jgi:hypothetical protein